LAIPKKQSKSKTNIKRTKRNTNMTYSSSLAHGRKSAGLSRNQNTASFRSRERVLGPVSNSVILIVLACLLGLLYLTQVTKTNAFGYKINDLQQKQSQLKEERDDLEVASARLQSIDRVAASAEAKNMVAVTPSATVQN
jgi:cell division protein FtsL